MAPSAELPSNRKFGTLFTAVFALLAVADIIKNSNYVLAVFWFVAALFVAAVTITSPARLAPFNKAWFLLGQWLGKIVSPVVLGIIFFGILTPAGFIARLSGHDPLRLKPRTIPTYWIDRAPPGPLPETFKNQF